MPATFTHPLAVLPLWRLCPNWLNFAALVIGSMAPDFGYYARQFPAARFAHTVPGTFAFCLPAGLVALGLFYLLRQPLCFLLPQPHRGALMPLAAVQPRLGARWLGSAAISILLGTWTHTIWDSFTHAGAWSVEQFPFLYAPLFRIGGTTFRTYYVLQHVSTFGGGAVLVVAYLVWLRRHRGTVPPALDSFSDRQRYGLLVLLAVISLAIAVPAALGMAAGYHGYTAFRVLVFRTGVYAAAAFVPMLVLASVVVYFLRGRNR